MRLRPTPSSGGGGSDLGAIEVDLDAILAETPTARLTPEQRTLLEKYYVPFLQRRKLPVLAKRLGLPLSKLRYHGNVLCR